ncbi:MAG: flagellar basal body M-ring protein FliF [Sideroxydans sp.]|nr:flagellar basal body M-ring protein FliF [Sideroxydans sp.]
MAENTLNSPLAHSLGRLGGQQKIGLIFAIGAVVALLAGMWMWGTTPDYRVLFSNLSDRDGGAIIESLQQMNVPYKFAEGGGALLVPAEQVHEVRLRLASQGLPKGGTVGFELMENQKFGTSQFLEQVNYQRAIEGELARSVQTLAAVQTARVHLAIPKQSVFVKEQQQPSASVILALYPGRSLNEGQVNAIVHLISSSVPDMPAKNVTLVDQNGTLLSSQSDSGSTPMDANQIKYVHQIEDDYSKRIEDIIAPLVGLNNVHAQVTADIDFTQTEQTAETFKPNQPPNQAALRSQQTVESFNGGAANAAGVPGALSNQPPVPATAPLTSPSANAVTSASGGSNTNSHKEATTNYEVDRTISYTRLPVGSIRRLSVALVVNNRTVTDKNGKVKSLPLTAGEKAQITSLAKEAVGFNEKRGDSLSVENSAFDTPKEVIEEVPLWQQPEIIALVKEILKYGVIAGIGIFLLFGIIRPSFKSLAKSIEVAEINEANASHAAGNVPQYSPQQPGSSYEGNLMAAKQMAQQDPKMVATVVKEWVSNE